MLKLYYGTSANYTALQDKETDALYFLTDTRKVMKGSVDYTEAVRFVQSMPASPVAGVIYIDASAGGAAKAFDGTNVVSVGTPTSQAINAQSTHGTTPTSKATYDAIAAAISTAEGYTDGVITGLDLANTYAALAGATFTGTIYAPTPGASVNDTTVATTAYVTSAISAVQQALAGAFHFKGTVSTEADLANVQNPAEGDVYQVTTTSAGTSAEFAYDGSSWVELGTVLDLSAYYTSSETDSAISSAIAAAASNYDAAGSAATAEQNAKDYADGLASNYDAAGSAAAAETAAESYADSAIATALTWTQLSAPSTGD